MAFRPGNGDPIQSDTTREHRWRAAREAPGVHAAWPLRQPLPHQRVGP